MSASALYSRLSNDSAVKALVGDHIYPSLMPESNVQTLQPTVVYSRVSMVPERAQDGVHRWVRWQVDCWAADYDTADSLAAAVTSCLEGAQMQGVGSSVIDADRDDRDINTGLYRRILECLTFEEAAA